jgi:hypothetical protein
MQAVHAETACLIDNSVVFDSFGFSAVSGWAAADAVQALQVKAAQYLSTVGLIRTRGGGWA